MAFRIHSLFVYTALFLLGLYNVNSFSALEQPKAKSPILGFSWGNCGPASDSLKIKSLTVTPDPIRVPGNITMGMTFSVASPLPDDVHVSVNMEKKVGIFWIKVPCTKNVGSCNYGNICASWTTDCPKYFEKYGLPCTCPFPANNYTIPDLVVDVTSKLPSGANGDFQITADMVSSTGHLGCVKLSINLQ